MSTQQKLTNPEKSPEPAGNGTTGRALRRHGWWVLLIVLLMAVGLVFASLSSRQTEAAPAGDLVAAQSGPLTISVSSSGSIRSGDAVVIKNRVEGRTTILWIIEEGTRVEEGDKLMELDASALEDERLEEEIEVASSKAAHINAQQMLEIARKQGEADIEAARVAYRLALLDLEKYAGIDAERYERLREESTTQATAAEGSILSELNELAGVVAGSEESRQRFEELLEEVEGSYKVELKKALNAIIIADEEMQRARDKLDGSRKLHEKGYITQTELDADRLEYRRVQLNREVAAEELELLAQFTYKRTIEELMSAVHQKEFELERAKHLAKANIVDAEANVSARQERLVRDQQHLRQINEQLEACIVRAPQAGMVVYGTTGQDRWDREEPLDEGVEVREQQDLFRLPATDTLVADIKIHESVLEKVTEGMPVRITTDALPDRTFQGKVQKISVLPDSQSQWMNPDLKVYNTVVEITGNTGALRTGMSCVAEIIVDELDEALYVPIQAVVRVGGRPTVYVPGPEGELRARTIEVGLDDNRMIQVTGGLEAGDLVSLTPPLEAGDVRLAAERAGPPQEPSLPQAPSRQDREEESDATDAEAASDAPAAPPRPTTG